MVDSGCQGPWNGLKQGFVAVVITLIPFLADRFWALCEFGWIGWGIKGLGRIGVRWLGFTDSGLIGIATLPRCPSGLVGGLADGLDGLIWG